nr:hypothetical protein [uncultured Blautia sp.]
MDRKAEYTASTLRICIDEIKTAENDIKGRICGIAVKKQETFSGSSELFLLVDRLLDEIGKPLSSRKSRSFREEDGNQLIPYNYKPCIYHTSEEIQKLGGRIMTRDVTFTSRLRSSWQGIVKDEKNHLIGKFESDLEFIDLLYDHGVTGEAYNKD